MALKFNNFTKLNYLTTVLYNILLRCDCNIKNNNRNKKIFLSIFLLFF